jgi:hypothetical protein
LIDFGEGIVIQDNILPRNFWLGTYIGFWAHEG